VSLFPIFHQKIIYIVCPIIKCNSQYLFLKQSCSGTNRVYRLSNRKL